MLTGLCVLQMENGSSDQIVKVIDDDIDSDALDDILDGTYKGQDAWDENVRLYYFGNNEDSDGAMKTGNVNINHLMAAPTPSSSRRLVMLRAARYGRNWY